MRLLLLSFSTAPVGQDTHLSPVSSQISCLLPFAHLSAPSVPSPLTNFPYLNRGVPHERSELSPLMTWHLCPNALLLWPQFYLQSAFNLHTHNWLHLISFTCALYVSAGTVQAHALNGCEWCQNGICSSNANPQEKTHPAVRRGREGLREWEGRDSKNNWVVEKLAQYVE